MTGTALIVEGETQVSHLEPRWGELGRYGRANLLLTFGQALLWAAILFVMDSAFLPAWLRAASLLLFCLAMQGVFTMLHEFSHHNAHRNPRLAYLIGWITATLFGMIPTLMEVHHWGHHRRNRTPPERGEFIHDGERAWEKRTRYYAAIVGGLWLTCFLFAVVVPFLPYATAKWIEKDGRFNYLAEGIGDFNERQWARMRVEGLVFMAAWGGILWLGPWRWETLAIAYAAFAFSWSSLQWVYHLYTPLHKVEGAYNLRAPRLVRWLFLNFNCNLIHHRKPYLPWQELFAQVNPKETQPLWYRWLLVFRLPIPIPKDPAVLEKMLAKRYF